MFLPRAVASRPRTAFADGTKRHAFVPCSPWVSMGAGPSRWSQGSRVGELAIITGGAAGIGYGAAEKCLFLGACAREPWRG